ncbi:MAG: hypothetical protein ACI4F7_09615 [Acutalibacteraceae bacterium]
MSGFTSFLTALCAALVFIGALHLICPDGAMAKPVKYILSLVFLVTVISAAGLLAGGFDGEWDFKTESYADNGELDTAAAKYVYAKALEAAEINFTEITVCTDKTEDGGIVISKLIIYSDCTEERIRSALGAAAENIEVEVVNE